MRQNWVFIFLFLSSVLNIITYTDDKVLQNIAHLGGYSGLISSIIFYFITRRMDKISKKKQMIDSFLQ